MSKIEKPFRPGPSVAAAAPPSRRVAVLIETSHGSARESLRGIADYLRQQGLRWSIDHEPRRMETGPPSWLSRWRGDGIIARVHCPKTLAAIERAGLPAVDLWGQPWASALPHVRGDDIAAARLVTDHLCGLGFRQFAFVGVKGFSWSDRRRDAFRNTVGGRGFPCEEFEFPDAGRAGLPPASRSLELSVWLRRQRFPLGILAANDHYAAIVVAACAEAGLTVPEQVAIVGVDNDDLMCELTTPSITSVSIDHRRHGYEAARILASLMDGEARGLEAVVRPRGLVCRQSTAGIAVANPVVAAALEAIRVGATGPLTIDDVAARVGVSRAGLTRAFAAAVGHGIHEEIVRVRLREAQRLLAETELKLEMVARRSGFEHPQHLGRVFRRELGLTPGAYRRSTKASASRR